MKRAARLAGLCAKAEHTRAYGMTPRLVTEQLHVYRVCFVTFGT